MKYDSFIEWVVMNVAILFDFFTFILKKFGGGKKFLFSSDFLLFFRTLNIISSSTRGLDQGLVGFLRLDLLQFPLFFHTDFTAIHPHPIELIQVLASIMSSTLKACT